MLGSATFHSLADDPAVARESRVRAWIAAIWVLSLFDYVHTVTGIGSGLADECNPVALWVMPYGPMALLSFKLGLVATSTLVLYMQRRRALAEVLLATGTVALAVTLVRWQMLYALHDFCLQNAPPGYTVF